MMILTELKLWKPFLILSKDIHHCIIYNVLSLRHKSHCKWDELMKFDRELHFPQQTESCQSFHVPLSSNSWKLKLVHLEQRKNKYLSHKKTSICVLYSWIIKIMAISSPMTAHCESILESLILRLETSLYELIFGELGKKSYLFKKSHIPQLVFLTNFVSSHVEG